MENQFGRTSRLQWEAVKKDEKTILKDVYFTSPYKIMSPFEQKDGSIRVMMLSASAGIMAGDESHFQFTVQPGAKVEFLSQSFEKIHKMEEGYAKRNTTIQVAAGGSFFYHPLPVIPFAQSAFENQTSVVLEDDRAEFEYYEILSCGRSARGERFGYQRFLSHLQIRKGAQLIFCDNTRFVPELMSMEEMGFYEGYSHLGNFVFCNRKKDATWLANVKAYLKERNEIQGGATLLESGDVIVKILGNQAQQLQDIAKWIAELT